MQSSRIPFIFLSFYLITFIFSCKPRLNTSELAIKQGFSQFIDLKKFDRTVQELICNQKLFIVYVGHADMMAYYYAPNSGYQQKIQKYLERDRAKAQEYFQYVTKQGIGLANALAHETSACREIGATSGKVFYAAITDGPNVNDSHIEVNLFQYNRSETDLIWSNTWHNKPFKLSEQKLTESLGTFELFVPKDLEHIIQQLFLLAEQQLGTVDQTLYFIKSHGAKSQESLSQVKNLADLKKMVYEQRQHVRANSFHLFDFDHSKNFLASSSYVIPLWDEINICKEFFKLDHQEQINQCIKELHPDRSDTQGDPDGSQGIKEEKAGVQGNPDGSQGVKEEKAGVQGNPDGSQGVKEEKAGVQGQAPNRGDIQDLATLVSQYDPIPFYLGQFSPWDTKTQGEKGAFIFPLQINYKTPTSHTAPARHHNPATNELLDKVRSDDHLKINPQFVSLANKELYFKQWSSQQGGPGYYRVLGEAIKTTDFKLPTGNKSPFFLVFDSCYATIRDYFLSYPSSKKFYEQLSPGNGRSPIIKRRFYPPVNSDLLPRQSAVYLYNPRPLLTVAIEYDELTGAQLSLLSYLLWSAKQRQQLPTDYQTLAAQLQLHANPVISKLNDTYQPEEQTLYDHLILAVEDCRGKNSQEDCFFDIINLEQYYADEVFNFYVGLKQVTKIFKDNPNELNLQFLIDQIKLVTGFYTIECLVELYKFKESDLQKYFQKLVSFVTQTNISAEQKINYLTRLYTSIKFLHDHKGSEQAKDNFISAVDP